MFLVANVCIARFLYIWYVVNSSFESSSGGFYKQTAYKQLTPCDCLDGNHVMRSKIKFGGYVGGNLLKRSQEQRKGNEIDPSGLGIFVKGHFSTLGCTSCFMVITLYMSKFKILLFRFLLLLKQILWKTYWLNLRILLFSLQVVSFEKACREEWMARRQHKQLYACKNG